MAVLDHTPSFIDVEFLKTLKLTVVQVVEFKATLGAERKRLYEPHDHKQP